MYFTSDDITTIIKALEKRGYLSTPPTSAPISTVSGALTDTIDLNTRVAVGNDNGNFHIYTKDWISSLNGLINIDRVYSVSNQALDEVIELIPLKHRCLGLVITFTNAEEEWEMYQYTGKVLTDTQWLEVNNWNKIN